MKVKACIIVWRQLGEGWMDELLKIIEKLCDIRYGCIVEEEEIVVGFDDDVVTLLDQLTQTSIKQLQVISIVGMAGLGKTTLARRLYRDPLIEYHLDICAWTYVSQIYLKRNLLLGILKSFIHDLTEEIYEMSDEQLGEKLYRLLKGRKYLVVFDDIWDCTAWNDLKIYFPDDKVGSRVVFTSRDIHVTLHVRAARPAHVLRLRTKDESWDIFRRKVFRTGICFSELRIVGREIADKWEGLPLAIVIAAADYDTPVTKLIWQWIAKGLIHPTGSRILEDVAEDFLMNLIKRSLLMTSKKTADGHIKACRIHDLLRDLCLTKAKEENFSPETCRCDPVTITDMLLGMPLNPLALTTHSGIRNLLLGILCFVTSLFHKPKLHKFLQDGGLVYSKRYKSLRILDAEYSMEISLFPSAVIQLGNLRYLAIQAYDGSPQASISNLVKLQMLIISSRKNVVVPKTIWNMVNLRHLYIKSGENHIEEPSFAQMTENDELGSLQTLSQVSPQSCYNIFSRTPNLRKLGFCGPLISSLGDLDFPSTASLQNLQKLKLLNTLSFPEPTRSCNPIMFPEMLKKLTLCNTGMDWEEMWSFSLLPNLEVLKLKFHACIGERWETSDAEFGRLKILKMHGLGLSEWVCSRDNFPGLQRLVVHHCLKLKSIPMDLGRILTLEVIEVQGCNMSAKTSALKIKEEQESEGNCFLKVHATNNV